MNTILNESKKWADCNPFGVFAEGVKFAEQWISVDEELPEEGSWVLSIVDGHFGDEAWVVMSLYYKAEFNNHGNHRISHWRPISHK